MLTKYHAPIVPATAPKDTMAALAFLVCFHGSSIEHIRLRLSQRSIAAKSMAAKSNRGKTKASQSENGNTAEGAPNTTSDVADKNYWRLTETELIELYRLMGDDRAKGLQWAL